MSGVLAEMVLLENKWFAVSLKTFIHTIYWKICCVILIHRCHCTVDVYPIVVPTCPILGIFRLLSCIACFLDFMDLMSLRWVSSLPVFLRGGGGGSASFSKFASMFQDTSVRSTLGSGTLSIMRQFIADVEKDYEEESGIDISELNVKGSHHVKDTSLVRRHPTLNQEAIKALRKLIEDFEYQLQCQSEVDEEVTSEEEEEEPPQELAINAAVQVQDEEYDEVSLQSKPQLYLCDDWVQPMATMRKPKELTAKDKVKALQCIVWDRKE